MSMTDDSKVRAARFENPTPDGGFAKASEERPGGDPLAELARLIGQDDLFDQMRKDAARAEIHASVSRTPADEPGPAPEWLTRPRRAADELRGSHDDGIEQGRPSPRHAASYPHGDPLGPGYGQAAHADAYAQDERYAGEAEAYVQDPHHADAHRAYEAAYDQQAAYDPSYPDGAADARGHESDSYAGEPPYDEAYEEPPRQRRRGGLMAVVAVLAVAAVGTAGAFGYRALTGSSGAQPPVIKADGTPAKIVPAPQGADGQGGKLIYDRADKPQGEKVVLREEQPIDMRDTKPAGPKMVTTSAISASGAPGAPPPTAMAYASGPATTSGPGAAAGEPKKVKTFAIRPDGSTEAAGSRSPAAASAPRATSAPPQTGDSARAPTGAPMRTASIPAAGTTAPSTTASAPPTGAYVVQLVSNKSEAEAQSAFKGLQAKYPGVLGNRTALIRRVELGDRGTYYRAQVGPFANVEQANALCDTLKAAGGPCIVQRN
jgi:sporulation related protein